jgi:predicted DsbA family dithiol-disulfide isomerase
VRELEIVLDYVDPGSWLVFTGVERWWRSLAPSTRDTLRIRWSPLELSPPDERPLDPQGEGWRWLAARCASEAAQFGTPFEPPPGLPRTRLSHALAWHGTRENPGDPWQIHGAIFRARFAEGLDIGRVDVLVRLSESMGLDASEVHTLLGIDRYAVEVEGERARLLGEGIRGVPTLRWVGEGGWLEGFHGMASLEAFLTAPPMEPEPENEEG